MQDLQRHVTNLRTVAAKRFPSNTVQQEAFVNRWVKQLGLEVAKATMDEFEPEPEPENPMIHVPPVFIDEEIKPVKPVKRPRTAKKRSR